MKNNKAITETKKDTKTNKYYLNFMQRIKDKQNGMTIQSKYPPRLHISLHYQPIFATS